MFKFVTSFFSKFSKDIGIDLGTANTLVYVKGEGIVISEPSVVAIKREGGEILAVGDEAKRMLGRTPGDIMAIRPLRDGVIADFEVTEKMIGYFIRRALNRSSIFQIPPRTVVGIPSGITEVERRAVKESALNGGAREVFLIEEPMAAAMGANIQISEPSGNMIVDIGGGTTEVAVISLGGLVTSKCIRTAGDEMDEAIVQYAKKAYNLLIGDRTAEEIKIKIGSAFPLPEEQIMQIKGRDAITGLPRTLKVSSEEVREALSESITSIVRVVTATLEETPPELSSDIVEKGIILTGGGSLLKGIDKLLSKETGLSVIRADDPLKCVALGTGKYLGELEKISRR
jgi:rod shape-determining protein MreB